MIDLASAGRHAERYPIDYAVRRLTDPQRLWLSVGARVALWRGGNQLGKSWGMAVDIVLFARGQHPWQRKAPHHRPPVKIMVVSYSLEQMKPLLAKIWSLLPKHEIDPQLGFSESSGLTGHKDNNIEFIAGPGKGSVITISTYKQGSGRIAGGTYHRIYLDEPPPEHVYSEIRPRVNVPRGHIRISFTPTLKSQDTTPVYYLRKKVEKGKIYEQQTDLTPENTTIRGGLVERCLMPQAEIDAFIDDGLEAEIGMRLRGDWDPIEVDRWLTTFGPHNLYDIDPPSGWKLGVGVDYGLGAGKQTAVLMAIHQVQNLRPIIVIWDEYAPEDDTTMIEDALGIKAMLTRNGLEYKNIDYWCGDTPTGKNKWGQQKNNKQFRRHLAAAFGRKISKTKFIYRPPDKGSGSELRMLRLFKGLMKTQKGENLPAFRVNPRCVHFRHSVMNYKGGAWSPHKHIIDCTRYIFELMINKGNWSRARVVYS